MAVLQGNGQLDEHTNFSLSSKIRKLLAFIVVCGLSVSVSSIVFGSEEMTENDESLLELAKKYYEAVVKEDEETLSSIVRPWNDTVKEETFALNDKLNSIDNVKTYSMNGPVDGSWLVYPCCDACFVGMDQGVPTLFNPLIVITTDTNDLVICSERAEYADFINEANMSNGVQALINDVNKQYETLRNGEKRIEEESASLSTYEGILEVYTQKMEDVVPQLIDEYNQESAGISDISKLAEIWERKVSVLADIWAEGSEKMGELMLSNGDSYDTYNSWSQKLFNNYQNYAQKINDVYLNSSVNNLLP